jgi:hypothetical protein
VGLACPGPSAAVGGAPANTSYVVADNTGTGGPTFDWSEIAGQGIVIPRLPSTVDLDYCAGPIALPFSFPFFGQLYDKIYVNQNGMLTFVNSSRSFASQPIPRRSSQTPPTFGIPDPDDFIAPLWVDLDNTCRPGQEIYYQSFPGGATPAHVVFEWHDWDRSSLPRCSGASYTFQAVLYADGTIVFQYLTISGQTPSATIGLENQDGSFGWSYGAGVASGRAVRFTPGP